jgi:hypothetical protein
MKRKFIWLSLLSIILLTPSVSSAKAKKDELRFAASVGIGAGFPIQPEEFDRDWDPSFGLLLDFAAAKEMFEVSVSLDYNFFLSNSQFPNDANVMALFANFKIKPIAKTSIRPYLIAGGGYFRYWIVDLNVYDNSLGFGGGAGVELEISDTQRLFIEAKNIVGRTRNTNPQKANTYYLPVRVGLTFIL